MVQASSVEIRAVEKHFGAVPGAEEGRPVRRARQGVLPDRPVGLRQVDAPALHQLPRALRWRRDPHRRPARRLQVAGRPEDAGARAARHAPQHRHGVPALQSLAAHDRPAERRRGPAAGARHAPQRGRTARRRGAEQGRPRRQDDEPSGPAVRRPAAARGDRPGDRDGAEADAVRRADLGARPGARRRGAERDEGAGSGRA